MPDFTMFTDYETFKKLFGEDFAGNVLQKVSRVVDSLVQDELIDLIHLQTGKWPHNLERDVLIAAAKRIIQTKFYEQLYKKKAGPDVLARDVEFINRLLLKDEPFVAKKKEKPAKEAAAAVATTATATATAETPPKPKAEKPPKPPKEKKPKKPKSEFGQKIAPMKLEEVIAWAIELGVEQEKIDQHKAKPLGLAKMNLGNLIQGRLRKNQASPSLACSAATSSGVGS